MANSKKKLILCEGCRFHKKETDTNTHGWCSELRLYTAEDFGCVLGSCRVTNARQVRPISKDQAVGTPRPFLDAVVRRFLVQYGLTNFTLDLAGDEQLHVCERYITEEQNSLEVSWPIYNWSPSNQELFLPSALWLNPPFKNIRPWVEKACLWRYQLPTGAGNDLFVLVPASVGTKWYKYFVAGYADIYFLSPRLIFEGHEDPFPKDLMLLHYHAYSGKIIECWDWTV